ncbi:MAG: tetratricopeptide repeat protein [Acidobacteriota bacterium]|nr:tetratricopeptide repeat protein [Acidobacteriota bacterium]
MRFAASVITASLLLSLSTFAQTGHGKLHGRVLDPAGTPVAGGTVALSLDGGHTAVATIPVGPSGDFSSADVPPGTYALVYRKADTPPGQMVDMVTGVVVADGADKAQDVDMSRAEFLAHLSPEERKRVEDQKSKNAAILHSNTQYAAVNADLTTARAYNQAKKFDDAEALMQKDIAAYPEARLTYVELGTAEIGLKKYPEAEQAFLKVLDKDPANEKLRHAEDFYGTGPTGTDATHMSRNTVGHAVAAETKLLPEIAGMAYSSLGEIYIQTQRPGEAQKAYDDAVAANPAKAALYYGNEAILFYQKGDSDRQLAAAEKALAVDPNRAVLYYFKGQALATKATVDSKTQKLVLPPGCLEAYQKYLALAPTGQFAGESKGILDAAGAKIESSYKAGKK